MKLFNWKNTSPLSGFWHEKEELNRKVTINAVYDRFYETGRIEAFKFNWHEGMANKPHIYWDSDVAKWIEGAAYILYRTHDEALEKKVDDIIDLIEKNITDDGYFNIYFTVVEPENRFLKRDDHELYCAGHLIEASVAYFEATGKDKFLKLMMRYADHIFDVFVTRQSAAFVTCGHPEIELALYRLYTCTKEQKYFDLFDFFIKMRGNNDKEEKQTYCQAHMPLFEQDYAIGHCVRAMYIYSALADYAYETNNEKAKEACKKLFDDVTRKKMYITGGIGSTHLGEAFTKPYDLPNDSAYQETCASISLMFFANRMLQLENNAKYADVVERAMYNGMLAGLSVSGDSFFYENPLEIYLKKHNRHYHIKERFPITQRVKVFECSCCPPNLNRTLSSMGNYIYGTDGSCVFINQYIPSTLEENGIKVTQSGNYPASGAITVKASGIQKIALRIPGWCKSFTLNCEYKMQNGYAIIENIPAQIEFNLEIKPFLVSANPKVYDNFGKAAVQMGPVVYCSESVDNDCELHTVYIDKNLSYTTEYNKELFCDTLCLKAFKAKETNELYFDYNDTLEDTTIKLIPYSLFANRNEADMRIWHNVK